MFLSGTPQGAGPQKWTRRSQFAFAKAAAPRQSGKVSWRVAGRSLYRRCKDSVLKCDDSGRIMWGSREFSVRTSVTVGKYCAGIPP